MHCILYPCSEGLLAPQYHIESEEDLMEEPPLSIHWLNRCRESLVRLLRNEIKSYCDLTAEKGYRLEEESKTFRMSLLAADFACRNIQASRDNA